MSIKLNNLAISSNCSYFSVDFEYTIFADGTIEAEAIRIEERAYPIMISRYGFPSQYQLFEKRFISPIGEYYIIE